MQDLWFGRPDQDLFLKNQFFYFPSFAGHSRQKSPWLQACFHLADKNTLQI